MKSYVLALRANGARESERSGTKAARLAELAEAGFNVPDGLVVTTDALGAFVGAHPLEFAATQPSMLASPLPDDVERSIRDGVSTFADVPLAVRSSGVDEDLPDASFAGQYETFLDVRGPDAVIEAVRGCWASAASPRVLAYRAGRRMTGPIRLAVLVQRLVRAECAGVAFSANPVTGRRDQAVVNAVAGLGERLVAGEATADEWVVGAGARPEPVRLSERSITPEQVQQVADLARRVEVHFGCPQDIEWAFEEGRLYLLQARPITALPDAVDWKSPAPGLWLRAFRLGEWLGDPISPLFETWLLEHVERRLFSRFEQISPAPTPRPYHVTVNGWYFTSGNFVPRGILEALWLLFRYFLPALVRNPTALGLATVRYAHRAMPLFEAQWRAGPREQYARAVEEAEGRVRDASAAELIAIVDRLADLAGDELFYFFAVGGSTWKLEAKLAKFYALHLQPTVGGSHQELLQGLGDASHTRAHVALSLDWTHPTLGELRDVGEASDESARRAEAWRRREDAVQRARTSLSSASIRVARTFDELLELAQHFGRVREEQASRLTLAWPVLRRAVHRLGEHLHGSRVLECAPDIHFLTHDELVEAVTSPHGSLTSTATKRREQWEKQRRLVPPLYVGSMGAIQRRVFGSLDVGTNDGAQATLRGVPASPGRATGRVRVIHGHPEFGLLERGEILVAPATNPGWTPLFARAAAVVTDTGSLMAHASLVAREYAIPAVVGTGDATQKLRDGQLVTVDGSAGTVVAHL